MKNDQLYRKLHGIMEFYIRTCMGTDDDPTSFRSETKKAIRESGIGAVIEADMLEKQIDSFMEELIEEAAVKFHEVAYLILEAAKVNMEEVRRFEILFLDLMKRTLVKSAKEQKPPSITIVIADSKVDKE